jgi:hypothetical protein
MSKRNGRKVDKATPRGTFKGLGVLESEDADKVRTDLYRQIRRASRTLEVLKRLLKSHKLKETRRRTKNILEKIDRVESDLSITAGFVNEGLAKVLDPRCTLAQLEDEEKKRLEINEQRKKRIEAVQSLVQQSIHCTFVHNIH